MASQIKITFTGGSLLGEERTLSLGAPALLGRSHSASVRLKEPDVSGQHLEFRDEPDGVHAVCLGRNGFDLNGTVIPEGESRKVGIGDVLTLGSRVRLRIDAVFAGASAGSDAGADSDSETFATRVFEPDATATVATQFARPDEIAAASADETFATALADADAVASAPASLRGSMDEAPIDEADSVSAMTPPHLHAPISPADENPTQDESATSSVDAAADFGVPDEAADAPTTGSATGLSDGETVEMKTRQASMDEIFRMKRMLEAKKRFRIRMVGFAALVFFVVLGTITFVNWPREERYLSHPTKPGTDIPDISTYEVRSESGSLEMEVDYPNAPGMSKSESASGIEIATFTGKKRNVPFRLSFVRRSDSAQLRLSLAECADAEVKDLKRRGYMFLDSDADSDIDEESRSGFLFFEEEYEGSCAVKMQHGTRFFRHEYVREEGGMKWHGILILLRDRIVVYRLMREIPEDAWTRGGYLVRVDPNINLTDGFLKNRWESSGSFGTVSLNDFDSQAESVRLQLDRGRVGDWSRIGKKIDMLMAMSFSGSADQRKTARNLLDRLRKMKSNLYNEFRMQYEIGLKERNETKMRQAFEACRGAFGGDNLDLRSRRINDPEEWSCQLRR